MSRTDELGAFRVTVTRTDGAGLGRHVRDSEEGSWVRALKNAALYPGEFRFIRDKEEDVAERKTLDLKVTVAQSDGDPDRTLYLMDKAAMRLSSNAYTLKVTSAVRADGLEFGLEREFEEYWRETHVEGAREGTDWSRGEKLEALGAFLHGVRFAREKGERG